MTPKVNDIIRIMEEIAPPAMAESWDNCGLQIGLRDQPVEKVVVALDPLPDVIDYCCSVGCDLLITHHPLIFKPLKNLDFSTPVGKLIQRAGAENLSVYSAHTNLDSVKGGLNDVLASRLGITGVTALGKAFNPEKVKLVFYAPVEHKEKILGALAETTAGIIGDYTCCSFLCSGQGTYRPGNHSNPYKGGRGEITTVDEVRIETVADRNDVVSIVKKIERVHPYETMAYDIYPLSVNDKDQGIGRVGILSSPCTLSEFASFVKQRLGLDHIKVAGAEDLMVNRVALCTGSGSGLLSNFFSSGADVYLSGDLHYHDARAVEEAGFGLVDTGHFASEIIMVNAVVEKLKSMTANHKYAVSIEPCPVEKDPFYLL